MFGMDAAVSPLLSTTEQFDPRVLPLMRDSELWEECGHSLREEWILFTSDRGNRSCRGETKKAPSFDPACDVCAGNQQSDRLKPSYSGVRWFTNALPCFAPPGEVPAPPNGTNHLSPLASHLSSVCSRRPPLGTAEVCCYHPNHGRTFADLNPREALEIVEPWTERYRALGEVEYVSHFHIFEAEASGPRVAFENSEFMDCLSFFPTDAHEVIVIPLRLAASLTGPELGEESTTNGSNPDQKTEALPAVSLVLYRAAETGNKAPQKKMQLKIDRTAISNNETINFARHLRDFD
jgi:hypothetical protein